MRRQAGCCSSQIAQLKAPSPSPDGHRRAGNLAQPLPRALCQYHCSEARAGEQTALPCEARLGPTAPLCWWTQRPPTAARWLRLWGAGPWEVPTPLARADRAPTQGSKPKLEKKPFQQKFHMVLTGLKSHEPAPCLSPVPRELCAPPKHLASGVPLGTELSHRCLVPQMPGRALSEGAQVCLRPPHTHLFRKFLAHQSHDQRCLPHLG